MTQRLLVGIVALILGAMLTRYLVHSIFSNHVSAAPSINLTAIRMLGTLISIDGRIPQDFELLDRILKGSPENFQASEISFLENMVLLTAVDFALLRTVDMNGRFDTPLKVTSVDFRLAAAKFDTMEGRECRTPSRIIVQKQLLASDIFLFTGDAAKYNAVDDKFTLRESVSPDQFKAMYYDNFVQGWVKKSPRAPLLGAMLDSRFTRFEAMLSWAKLQFATQQKETDILNRASVMVKSFGLQ